MSDPHLQGELLDCVVSPEWAVALAGASNTGHLQAALARPDLWLECQLLDKLLYKNANQHRGSQHYQRLQEVHRLLGLLRAQQLDRRVGALHDALAGAQQRGPLPTSSVLMAHGDDQRRVPSHQATAGVLRSVAAACQLIEELAPAVHRASLQLLAQLAHSFFMPLCLTSLAALARIQVLAGQLLLDAVQAYNSIAEVAALLPPSPAAGQTAAAASSAQQGSTRQHQELPQLLRAQWRGGRPQLELVPCNPGDSLAEQAAAACSCYALHILQPGPPAVPASAVVLEEGQAAGVDGGAAGQAAAAAQRRGRQQGKQAGAAASAPVLAVVEDRGVPISREAFASAAAAAAAAPPAAALAVSSAGPACAAAAPAEPPPLLLGVVEDSAPEEDAAGTVASLMEGEARGHLYRRAAAGLGPLVKRARRSMQGIIPAAPVPPPAAAAAASMAAAAAAATAAAAVGAAAAAGQTAQQGRHQQACATSIPAAGAQMACTAAAGLPAAKPAFLSVAQPGAVKPAFLSVAQPGVAKPAFLSVAAPAAKVQAPTQQPSAASAAPPADAAGSRPLAAAADAALGAAASPALALGGTARKRKKPAAAAAAAAAAAEQQREAAAPKSWEDWLQPLEPGPASAGAAVGQQQQRQQAGRGPKQQQQQLDKRRRGR